MIAVCRSSQSLLASALALAGFACVSMSRGGSPANHPPQPRFTSGWGKVVDGLQCRVKHLTITNFGSEATKVFLDVTLELTNVVARERKVLLDWRRGSKPPLLSDHLVVTLISKSGDELNNQYGVDLEDPVFTTNPNAKGVKDVFLSLRPRESKTIRVTLGIKHSIFSKDVENVPTKIRLYHIIPLRQQVFRGDMKARAIFWEGPMDTGEMILTRQH